MEAYKTECFDCGKTQLWTGYKTGVGKSPKQIEEMDKEQNTCTSCGSKNVRTTLDKESVIGKALDVQAEELAQIMEDLMGEE